MSTKRGSVAVHDNTQLSEAERVEVAAALLEDWWGDLSHRDQNLLMHVTEIRADGKGESARCEELAIRLQVITTGDKNGDPFGIRHIVTQAGGTMQQQKFLRLVIRQIAHLKRKERTRTNRGHIRLVQS